MGAISRAENTGQVQRRSGTSPSVNVARTNPGLNIEITVWIY